MTTRVLTNENRAFGPPTTAAGEVSLRFTLVGPDLGKALPVLGSDSAPFGSVDVLAADMVDGVFSVDLFITEDSAPESHYLVDVWQQGPEPGQRYHERFVGDIPAGAGAVQWEAFYIPGSPFEPSEWSAFLLHATTESGPIAADKHLTQADRDAIDGLDTYSLIAGEIMGGDKVVALSGGLAVLADAATTPPGAVVGFSASAVVTGDAVTIRRTGLAGISGLTLDALYYLGSAGGVTATPPATGLVQAVGRAQAATQLSIQLGMHYQRAA